MSITKVGLTQGQRAGGTLVHVSGVLPETVIVVKGHSREELQFIR